MIHNYIESSAEKLLCDPYTFDDTPIVLEKCALFLNVAIKPVALESDLSGFLSAK